MAKKVKTGDRVRLTKKAEGLFDCPEGRENNPTAVVQARMDDYSEGALVMQEDLRGCRYWNEADVAIVKRA